MMKTNDGANFWTSLHVSLLTAHTLKHELVEIILRNFLGLGDGPNRCSRGAQRPVRKVGGGNFYLPNEAARKMVKQGHSQRKRLFPSRTASTPNPNSLGA